MKQMCFSFRERDVLYRRFEHPPNSLRENVFSFFTLRNKLCLLKLLLQLRLKTISFNATIIFFGRNTTRDRDL